MAGLNNDNIPDTEVDASDHILSPQPFAPPSKELLVTSLEAAHLPSDAGSTIDDGQMSTQSYEYSSSGSSTRHSTSDIFGREMDDELEQMKSRASSRSSFSSVPASVLIHPLDQMKQMSAIGIHEQIAAYSMEEEEASFGGFDRPPQSIRTIRQREAAFRKPSSVRAMQMHTEDEADEDEFLTPPRRRAGMRSPGTSPLKRSPYYSPKTSQSKPAVKKEYPLVLLHCTLLAPSLPVPGAAEPRNQKIVEEVLPPQYWKRWRRLQDKVGSGVLRDRGVLISHPEDLYDMLEERLLESLELQRPLVHRGHFLGHEEADPGSEGEVSDREESETDGEQGDECPDCGGRVLHHSDTNRKWEIRVYAANGLMRAGAWAAAWKEMEKVDVEVGVWLPSDIRRALEKRLAEEHAAAAASAEHAHQAMVFHNPDKLDIDQRRLSVQTYSRTFSDAGSFRSSGHTVEPPPQMKRPDLPQVNQQHEIALRTLMINYIRVLAGDRRNVALVFMGVLVIFLAIGVQPQKDQLQGLLHSLAREDFVEMPAAPKVHISADVPALSVTSSSSILMEGIIPTSSVVASMPVSEVVAQSQVEETVPSPTASEVEPISFIPEPTPEAAPVEDFKEKDIHNEGSRDEDIHSEEIQSEEIQGQDIPKQETHGEEIHGDAIPDKAIHGEAAHDEVIADEEPHDEAIPDEDIHDEAIIDEILEEPIPGEPIHDKEITEERHDESQPEPVDASEELYSGETEPVESVEESHVVEPELQPDPEE
ncbi:uncharacterized protein N7496_011635 [Penicillium cataractarum]|uniref:Pathway-specific nitrogen regulator n=1 Tax=Penicillium cataractarum TaxID=2100454 RepID=A0A9W9RFV1_9EURO|nr:uncharacterized protein N7496_011635 [Penicillium cataractarum]KAJ5359222.1 hypothetical protein N7496_011635 [Penicillium cataractarum]